MLLFIPSLNQPATLPLIVNLLSFLSLHLHINHVKMNTFTLLWLYWFCFFECCLFQGDCDKLTEEIHQLNKSLLDSETIALDAKKESAFLRSENLELKEKMASTC